MDKKTINLTAYCGLYCPECYKMVVSNSAKSLKDTLENTHICGSTNNPSEQFKKELDNLISLRCPRVCKDGGGNPDCAIRKCCIEKNIVGCWDCNDFQICEKLTEQFVNNIKKIKEI